MAENEYFYCYSTRLHYYLLSFREKCYAERVNTVSGCRYWVFKKSKRLDELIDSYNKVKHKYS